MAATVDDLKTVNRIAESLKAEALGMTRNRPGVQVAVLVFKGERESLTYVCDVDEPPGEWDRLSDRLKKVAEDIRSQQREAEDR